MRDLGESHVDILTRLQEVNERLCRPALEESELVSIARSACNGRPQTQLYDAALLCREIDTLSFNYRGGETDWLIYAAFRQVATDAFRTSDLGVSTRRLAERAGVANSTASESVKRLVNMGLIRKTTEHTKTKAARYELLPPS